MSILTMPGIITRPGLHPEVDEDTYHAGRNTPTESLSYSWSKHLLGRSACPAKYRWLRNNGQPYKAAFEEGKAAHGLVLGTARVVRYVDWLAMPEGDRPRGALVDLGTDADWRGRWADEVKACRDGGGIPLKPSIIERTLAMEDSLQSNPHAVALLKGSAAEVPCYSTDPETGVWLRSKADAINGPLGVVVDYKTSASADPEVFAGDALKFGYHRQAAWYLDQLAACDQSSDEGDPFEFAFIVQEKTPPYLCSVVYLDSDFLEAGRAVNRRAIDTFAACLKSGSWPAYPSPTTVPPPPWLRATASLNRDLESQLLYLIGESA